MSTQHTYERKGVLLDIQGVTFTRNGVPILRDVNAQIRDVVRPGMKQGQIVGLLGPSGVVSHNYILCDHRSVLGNLTIAARQAGMSGADAKAAAMKYLERFGLQAHA